MLSILTKQFITQNTGTQHKNKCHQNFTI